MRKSGAFSLDISIYCILHAVNYQLRNKVLVVFVVCLQNVLLKFE